MLFSVSSTVIHNNIVDYLLPLKENNHKDYSHSFLYS
jgi:hypothetical protein